MNPMLHEWNVPFRALLDAAPDGIIVCNDQGVLALVNSAAERMFGYAHDELLGKPIDTLIPDHVRPRHHRHLASYVAEPRLRPMGSNLELQGRRKDGSEFPVEISLSPFTADRGLLIIAGVRDVTDRRELQREKQRATSYLISAVEAVQETFMLFDEQDRGVKVKSRARGVTRAGGGPPIIRGAVEEPLG